MIKKGLLATAALASMLTMGAVTAQAKTFVYCSEGSPEGFTPALYTSGTSFDASSRNIFNRLVEFERGSTIMTPGLAESWEVSEDGLSYTFKLRPGVKFHTTKYFTPTRELNADDVLFSFNRQWKADHPYHKVSGGTYEYFSGYVSFPDILETIEKVDDLTVKFTLQKPDAAFISKIAIDFASIHSAEYAQQMMDAGSPEKFDQEPIGTGPFQFVSYQKDAFIRYQANEDYWSGRAPLDKLVFAITPDAQVAYQKLAAGECHLVPYPNQADLASIEANKDLTVDSQEGMNVGYLAFNTEKKPFDDKRVRQALNYAMNKESIIKAVFQGAGNAAKNPLPPTLWGYNEEIQDYPYDPAKAKALLAEAGVTNLSTNIWAMPVKRPYNPNARRMAELIQADWANVGVNAEIVSMEWGEYLSRSQKGDHDTVLLGWTADYPDPDNFLSLLNCASAESGGNRARWCHKEFDDLFQEAVKVSDPEKRTQLYEQAQAVFKEEAPWVTVAHSVVHKAMSNKVVDFRIDPLGGHVFYGVDLEE